MTIDTTTRTDGAPTESSPRSARPVDPDRYVRPGGRGDRWANAVVRWLTARGISLRGSRVLTVIGRRSGVPRSTPVNLLRHDGERYLVAPRGRTEWVRNVRAAGGVAELALGRRVEPVTLVEVPVDERVPMIRAYVDAWYFEVGKFIEGLDRTSSDARILEVAPGMPVFRIARPTD
jgi:deazaflavin-dependent oxidoreductase (nitroreductase family)